MINKLLVCLDLSPYDKACVKQAVQLSKHLEAVQEVVLLHNIRFDFLRDVPEFAQRDYDQLTERIEEAIAKRFRNRFGEETSLRIKVTTADNTIGALEAELDEQGKTLLIVGHKRRKDGAGVVPLRLLGRDKYRSPILFAPKEGTLPGSEILVATDLSRQNEELFRFARGLGDSLSVQLVSLHVSKLPMAYFPYIGEDNAEMKRKLLREAEKKVTAFLQSQTNLTVDRVVTRSSNNVSRSIVAFFTEESVAGLLLLNRSSKGNLGSDLLGSITRSVLAEPVGKPILVR